MSYDALTIRNEGTHKSPVKHLYMCTQKYNSTINILFEFDYQMTNIIYHTHPPKRKIDRKSNV